MSYLKLSEQEQRDLASLGWAPPRPAKAYKKDGTEIVLNGDVGEDFLFMHRRMVAAVNKAADAAGDSWTVVGWDNCPPTINDPDWPVPPAYDTGDAGFNSFLVDIKGDDYYTNVILPEENWFNDDDNLRSVTLGELGVRLEFGIHTWFHLRFSAANSIGIRTQSPHPTEYIDPMWDVAEYDYLADFYSAHVNPYFWKIHGWVEKKIEAWANANGLEVAGLTVNGDDAHAINWIGTWEGGPMDVLDDINQVAADAIARESSTEDSEEDENHRLAVAGIVIGSVLGGVAIIAIFAMLVHKCVTKKKGNAYKGKDTATAQV